MYDVLLVALMVLAVLAPVAVGCVLGWCAHSVRRWQTGRRMARRITALGLEVAELRADRDRLLGALAELDSGPMDAVADAIQRPGPVGRHHRPGPSRPRPYIPPELSGAD